MSIGTLQRSLALSPTAQFMSQFEPIASIAIPFFMMTSDRLTWSNVGKSCIGVALAINEWSYLSSKTPHKTVELIHECNRILMLALFVNSIVKAYQTASWKPMRPLVLYTPLFASIGMSHPIFRIISKVSPVDTEVQPQETLEELMKAKLPFVIYSNDCSQREVHSLIHAFNKKNEKGCYPYKIFSLSIWELMRCGKKWKERFLEVFDYLKTQGKVILIIDEFEQILQLKDDTVVPHQFLMSTKLPETLQVIGITKKSSVLDVIPTSQTNLITKNPNPTIPKELVKVRKKAQLISLHFQREEAQEVLEILGNQSGMNRVCLVGDEEEEKMLLISSIAYLLKEAKPPLKNHSIYRVQFRDLLRERKFLKTDLLKPLEDANVILYVQGIEEGFQLLHIRELFSKINLKDLLDHPKIKLIISASQEQLEVLQRDHPSFEKTFVPHKKVPLPMEEQEALFNKEKERYPDAVLSADLQRQILAIRGSCTLREQCSILGQVVSIMSQRGCTEAEALAVVKVQVSSQSRSFLPPNLIELSSNPDEVICLERETEVLKVLITLHSKDGKNNVCLVGDAGCGKTQLVRFIASSIKRRDSRYCRHFEDYRVFSFSVSSIMSDSTYIGMWQGKLRKILEFCQAQGKVILFIDEIHLAIGNGKSLGNDTMDIAQMMKEYITDPNLRIIGATTPSEYNEYVKQDPAFVDRFNVIELAPLNEESQLKALQTHSVKYSSTGTPLPEKTLRKILSGEGSSLRTSLGKIAAIHSFLSLMGSDDIEEAVRWGTRIQSKKVSLPDHLIELTNSSEEVICLERADEMEEILITLYSEDGKNNVCLVGEAGGGKTQLVRYIASQIQKGAITQFQGYRVFNFAISAIIADSTYIGQWQGKLKKILEYCSRVQKAIVFIDEIHLAIGTGKTKGGTSMDLAQMMKEYITSPHLRIIGATTPEEYDQYFAADRAFADRFKRLDLPPLSRDKQLDALMAHSKKQCRDSPLEKRVLERILDSTKSLRTSIGKVAEVHAYMNFHQTNDVERALSWIRCEDSVL